MKVLDLQKHSEREAAEAAAAVLRQGGLVIYPTETVYGIGADATNPVAIEKLLRYKSRREGKPLSIAVTDQTMAEQYAELTDQAKELYKRFLPGPYTIVSRSKNTVTPGVASEFGTIGIRIPEYPLILRMTEMLGRPFTATSANASGEKRPYSVEDVLSRLSERQKRLIDLVLDAGTLPKNEPSTVIDTTLSTPLTVRGTWQEKAEQTFETHSEQETQDLAGKLMLKHWQSVKDTGLIIALSGELGAGKTVFTKGVAQFLKITESVSSPTYTYIHEYTYNRHGAAGILYHLDLWKIDSAAELERLKIPALITPGHVVVVEWWQQGAPFWPKESQPQLLIHLDEKDEHARKIAITETVS